MFANRSVRFWTALALLVLGTTALQNAEAAPSPALKDVVATLSTKRAVVKDQGEAIIDVAIKNTGTVPRKINLFILESAILSLDVYNAQGKRMSTVPPPCPRDLDPYDVILAPGQTKKFVHGLNIFSPALSGTYTVQMDDFKCNKLKITIK